MDLEKQKKKERERDNRWSWVVAFSCCFINFLLYGVARLSGMMMVAVSDSFHTNRASAALPFSVSTSIRNLSGFFVGYLGQRFGLRKTIAVGCGLSSLGAGLCFFVSDIRWMVVCWGGIFGIGFGLATCLLPFAINQNFNRYRGIASGICYSGSYIGSFVFPSLVVTLINEYGICGTLLIIGGTFLNGCAVAFLFREPSKKAISKDDDGEPRSDEVSNSCEKELNVSKTEENPNRIWRQLWQKFKSIFRVLKEKRSQTLSSYSSTYSISPRLLNIQMHTDLTLSDKSCCELISYKDSSTKQIKNYCFFERYPCNKSIRYYFPKRMKRAKYKRKITRIKFSLGTTITKKVFSFNQQLSYLSFESVKLVSFRRRKLSFNCIKMAASKITEMNLSQRTNNYSDLHNSPSILTRRIRKYSDLHNSPSNISQETNKYSNLHNSQSKLSHLKLNKIVNSEDNLLYQETPATKGTVTFDSEHTYCTYISDPEPFFPRSNHEEKSSIRHLDRAAGDTRFTSNGDGEFTERFDIEKTEGLSPDRSSRTLKCNLLKDAGKCLFGWSRLYSDPMFVVIAITMSLHTFVVVCMITIIEDFAKDIGIPECQVHYVLMVLSIADLIGSLTLGIITDRGFLSSCNFIILCFFGLFISQICLSYARSFRTLLTLVAVYGIFESGIIITFPLLIAHYIPKKKQPVAFASSHILSSPTVLLVPLVIGYFRDMKGCYSGAFYSLGMTSLSCCCAWLLASCTFTKCKSDKAPSSLTKL